MLNHIRLVDTDDCLPSEIQQCRRCRYREDEDLIEISCEGSERTLKILSLQYGAASSRAGSEDCILSDLTIVDQDLLMNDVKMACHGKYFFHPYT